MASSIELDPASGVLSIVGGTGNDMARVDYSSTTVTGPDGTTRSTTDTTSLVVRLQSDAEPAALVRSFPAAAVKAVCYDGRGGVDYLANLTTKVATWTTTTGGVVNTSLMVGSPGYQSSGATADVGVFRVGPSGQVGIDYLFRGAGYNGQLGIFSLAGMEAYRPGSNDYIREALRRCLSESTQGHVVIRADVEGARFSASLPWEGNMNRGTYQGVRSVAMNPGDAFGVLSVETGTIWGLFTGALDPKDPGVRVSLPGARDDAGTRIIAVDGDAGATWSVAIGGTAIQLAGARANVGPASIDTADLCVVAYLDRNDNGVADPADPSLPGMVVTLTGIDFAGRPVTRTAASASDGCTEFVGLPAGIYRVSGVDPSGRTLDGGSQVGGRGGRAAQGAVSGIVLLPGDDARGYALRRIAPATIRGAVYGDLDRDRIFDASEPGLAGVAVRLTGTDDRGARVDVSTRTRDDGTYRFRGLRPGSYTLDESQPLGWLDGRESIGSFLGQPHPIARNGRLGNDRVSGLNLRAGEEGYNYNFGEWASAPGDTGDQAQLDIVGTDAPDTVEILLGTTTHRIGINGQWQEFDATVATLLTYDGLDGDDTVKIVGLPGSETMTTAPGSSTLIAPGLRLEINGASWVIFEGGKGDRGFLYDTPGDDLYTATPCQRTLDGTGHRATVVGVERVYAYATSGGTDTATLTDSAANDTFKATPGDARMYSDAYSNYVRGFDRVEGVAGLGGVDRAYLYDSAGDDTLVADPSTATLRGADFALVARGFSRVDASSIAGGEDRATLVGSAGDDRFYAGPIEGQMIGSGYDNHAIGFASVVGSGGAGGFDRGYLTGTQADDMLVASSARARLTGPGLDVTAEALAWVLVSGGSCLGTDTAQLADSAGNDVLEATPNTARLYGANYTIRVENFTTIAATASAGGVDKAVLRDSAGDDRLDATPARARLSGRGFDNLASGFATIEVDGSAGGYDRAVLVDGAGDDTLSTSGSGLSLTTTGLTLRVSGFESISATSTTGRNRKKLAAIDFALDLLGTWVS